jgi:hypothetical protein
MIDEKKIHKDTFNFEKYNKDKIKEIDEHNKKLFEKYSQFDEITLVKEARKVSQYLTRKSLFINWEEGQYEEIFGHS